MQEGKSYEASANVKYKDLLTQRGADKSPCPKVDHLRRRTKKAGACINIMVTLTKIKRQLEGIESCHVARCRNPGPVQPSPNTGVML